MNAARLQEIEKIFHAALERPASQRAAFVEEACAGDGALREEVESLLAHEDAGSFIESPAIAVAAKALAPDGNRFAMFPIPEAAGPERGSVHVTFPQNFLDELRRQ